MLFCLRAVSAGISSLSCWEIRRIPHKAGWHAEITVAPRIYDLMRTIQETSAALIMAGAGIEGLPPRNVLKTLQEWPCNRAFVAFTIHSLPAPQVSRPIPHRNACLL
jgi:hypothetical protein